MYGLEISGLSLSFNNFSLKDINLNIRKGCVTGLIGKNGAGKTTLIKTIMRQYNAESGRILYDGKKFAGNETEILSDLACVFDKPPFMLNLKPKRIEKIYTDYYTKFDVKRYHGLMARFNLPEDLRLSKYSFGMQRKFCLILALCQGGDILILDEPTAGIDPADRAEVISLIQEYMLDESHTVIFSTHITEDLDRIADYIVMIEDGRVILDEDKVTLTDNYRLVTAPVLTDGMKKAAIGIKESMFGYTFLTKENCDWEGVEVKIPTVEEIFIHMTGSRDPSDPFSEFTATM